MNAFTTRNYHDYQIVPIGKLLPYSLSKYLCFVDCCKRVQSIDMVEQQQILLEMVSLINIEKSNKKSNIVYIIGERSFSHIENGWYIISAKDPWYDEIYRFELHIEYNNNIQYMDISIRYDRKYEGFFKTLFPIVR